MELRSCVLAEVEPGDISPGVPGPSTLATEGSGEIVPVCVVGRSSTAELETGPSLSPPDAAGLNGATLRAPITSAPQMSGSLGVTSQPDVETEFRQDVGTSSGSEMGLSAQPTQPRHPPLDLGMVLSSVSGYHDVSRLAGTSGFHRMTTGMTSYQVQQT